MKKSFISLSVLSLLFIGLSFIVNAYSEEHPKDQPITTDTSNAFITASSNDISNPIVTNSLDADTASPTTASSEQESQTSLWDIEDKNEVNYDSDQTHSPELAEQEVMNIKELYEKGISEGKVTRELYSYEAFQENYQANKTTYEEMKDIFPDYYSYSDWFAQIMNYAAFPDGEGHSPSETKREKKQQKNKMPIVLSVIFERETSLL